MDSLPHLHNHFKRRDRIARSARTALDTIPAVLMPQAVDLHDAIEAAHGGHYPPMLDLFVEIADDPLAVAQDGPNHNLPPEIEAQVIAFAAQVAALAVVRKAVRHG